jgi:solute carrier family 25 folate transporter 32
VNNIASAVTAGAISTIITSPIWTVRTRMQTQVDHSDYKNTMDAFRKISSREGIIALYRGVVPSMFGLIHVAIQFPLYEYLKDEIKRKSGTQSLSTTHLIAASSLSKIIASVIAYPHEVVRTRLQDSSHSRHIQQPGVEFRSYSGPVDAVSSIWKQEGVTGFYRGIIPNLIRTVPAAVITLVSYEQAAKLLKSIGSQQSIQSVSGK